MNVFNGFMLRSFNKDSDYDKEMLKQTMLEHETTFRKQVYELHRLYRTQKDMTEGHRNQELYKHTLQNGTHQSYLFPSAMASECNGNMWHQPYHMTEPSAGFHEASIKESDYVKPLYLLEENHMQPGQMRRKVGGSLNDFEFSYPKLKGHPMKTIDLQLPADVYINVEDSESEVKEHSFMPFPQVNNTSSITSDIDREDDVKLTLGTRDDCTDPTLQNVMCTQRLDYWDGTKKGLTCDGLSGSISNHFPSVRSKSEYVHGYQSSTSSTRSFMPQNFFTDKDRDAGACSNFFDPDKGKAWQSFNLEDGREGHRVNNWFTLGLSSEKLPVEPEQLQLNVKREESMSCYDHGETRTWLEEKPTIVTESYRSSPFFDPNNLGIAQFPGPLSITPCLENMHSVNPVVSTKRKIPRNITHIPIAVQALPCFPASGTTKYFGRKPKGSIRNKQSNADFYSLDLQSDPKFFTQCRHNNDGSVQEKVPGLQHDISCSSTPLTKARDHWKVGKSSEGGFWLCNHSPEKSPSHVKKKRKRKTVSLPMCDELQQNAFNTSSSNDIKDSEMGFRTNTIDLNLPTEDEVQILSCDTLDIEAAEYLLGTTLSSSKQLESTHCDSLHWFADMVLSEAANPVSDEDNGEDDFESKTLKLEEVKVEEYLPIPHEGETSTGSALLLLPTTRRGQVRKRKDFQKDVLLGLVSLSRHQVTEDLQAFHCLMTAMGEEWKCKVTGPCAGRKGSGGGQGRGKQRAENSTEEEIRWGRTTRRGRRPRVKPLDAAVVVF